MNDHQTISLEMFYYDKHVINCTIEKIDKVKEERKIYKNLNCIQAIYMNGYGFFEVFQSFSEKQSRKSIQKYLLHIGIVDVRVWLVGLVL